MANDDDCMCRTATCTASSTGLFCTDSTSTGRCAHGPPCVHTDGSTASDAAWCTCGTAECTEGQFCDGAASHCSDTVDCAVTDGSEANAADCRCGIADCSSAAASGPGLFCHRFEEGISPNGVCRASGAFTAYIKAARKPCADVGAAVIADAETCRTAIEQIIADEGRSLQHGIHVIENNNDIFPSGCSVDSNSWDDGMYDSIFNPNMMNGEGDEGMRLRTVR